tara:strand:- start:344 stop:958 length:615 start_codon:yes stop_codon:yes gene_type:complete
MIRKIKFQFIIVLFIILINNIILFAKEENYKIIKLVNEQVITNYDLQQRIRLYAVLNNTIINSETIDKVAENILSTMVDELLQLEKIIEYKIFITDEDINSFIKRAYLSEEKNIEDFSTALKDNNLDIKILKKTVKISLGWNELSGRLFYRTSKISKIDLEKTLESDPSLSIEQAETILLQKQIGLRAKKLLRDIRTEANIENR